MTEAGFEPTITAIERAKTVHASDRSATVTGPFLILLKYNPVIYNIFEKVSNI
jgi:hypothetical protein